MKRNNFTTVTRNTGRLMTATLLCMCLNISAAEIHQNINRIESNSINNVSGVIGINIASGDNNIQTNTRSIAIGKNAQSITKSELSTQPLDINSSSTVSMAAYTLHNAHGIISINQVSGSGNIQVNDMTIALGENTQLISDISLDIRPATTRSPNDADSENNNKIHLDKNSLKGASGTIQVNQIAGNGNIAVNRVSMPIN